MVGKNDQWLVRTFQNVVAGPFTREQVIELIEDGQLARRDEVCLANHYWFHLYEKKEVKSALGIDPPKPAPGDQDDLTETETETTTAAATQSMAGDIPIPELPQELKGEDKAVLSNRAFRQPRPTRPKDGPFPTPARISAAGKPDDSEDEPEEPEPNSPMIERVALIKWSMFVMIAGLFVILMALLILTRT